MKTLKQWREFKGITQIELGRQAGMHATQISQYERGVNVPTKKNRKKLADVLKLQVDDIDWQEKTKVKFVEKHEKREELGKEQKQQELDNKKKLGLLIFKVTELSTEMNNYKEVLDTLLDAPIKAPDDYIFEYQVKLENIENALMRIFHLK